MDWLEIFRVIFLVFAILCIAFIGFIMVASLYCMTGGLENNRNSAPKEKRKRE